MTLDESKMTNRRAPEAQAERNAAEFMTPYREGDEHPIERMKRFFAECQSARKAKRDAAVNTTKAR